MRVISTQVPGLINYTCPIQDCNRYSQVFLPKTNEPKHLCCRHWKRRVAINLAWLRTCKQLYIETKEIPYRTNGFAFFSGDALQRFLDRSGPLVSQVKCIVLDCFICTQVKLEVWVAPLDQIPQAFTKLQVIRLKYRLSNRLRAFKYLSYKSPEQIEAGMLKCKKKTPHERYWQAIVRLKVLPLQNALLKFAEGSSTSQGPYWGLVSSRSGATTSRRNWSSRTRLEGTT